MKIWVDDERPTPSGYHGAKSVNQAIALIEFAEEKQIEIELLDLDHDLGQYAYDGGDAIRLLDYLVERGTFYPIKIHTQNTVGRQNIQRVLDRFWN